MGIEIWMPIFLFQILFCTRNICFWFVILTSGNLEKAWNEQRSEGNENQSQWIFAFLGCLLLRASTLFKQKVHWWEGIDERFIHPPPPPPKKKSTPTFFFIFIVIGFHCLPVFVVPDFLWLNRSKNQELEIILLIRIEKLK